MNESSIGRSLPLLACLEAVLFAAPAPLTVTQCAYALDCSPEEVEEGLRYLHEKYQSPENQRGLRLQRHGGRYQLTSAPEAASQVERLLGMEISSRLSRASLEALAIIAYQQPVTRPQIDAIRGVNSDGVLKSLLNKGLIQEVGRSEAVGRPILYSTTTAFLQAFGLNSLDELPPINMPHHQTLKTVEVLKG